MRLLKWMHNYIETDAVKNEFLYKLQLLPLNRVASVWTTDNVCNSMPLCFYFCLSFPLFTVMSPKPSFISPCYFPFVSISLISFFFLSVSFPILSTVSHLRPGHRSVPAHRGSGCSHSTVVDRGWTGRPCRKDKYVLLLQNRSYSRLL